MSNPFPPPPYFPGTPPVPGTPGTPVRSARAERRRAKKAAQAAAVAAAAGATVNTGGPTIAVQQQSSFTPFGIPFQQFMPREVAEGTHIPWNNPPHDDDDDDDYKPIPWLPPLLPRMDVPEAMLKSLRTFVMEGHPFLTYNKISNRVLGELIYRAILHVLSRNFAFMTKPLIMYLYRTLFGCPELNNKVLEYDAGLFESKIVRKFVESESVQGEMYYRLKPSFVQNYTPLPPLMSAYFGQDNMHALPPSTPLDRRIVKQMVKDYSNDFLNLATSFWVMCPSDLDYIVPLQDFRRYLPVFYMELHPHPMLPERLPKKFMRLHAPLFNELLVTAATATGMDQKAARRKLEVHSVVVLRVLEEERQRDLELYWGSTEATSDGASGAVVAVTHSTPNVTKAQTPLMPPVRPVPPPPPLAAVFNPGMPPAPSSPVHTGVSVCVPPPPPPLELNHVTPPPPPPTELNQVALSPPPPTLPPSVSDRPAPPTRMSPQSLSDEDDDMDLDEQGPSGARSSGAQSTTSDSGPSSPGSNNAPQNQDVDKEKKIQVNRLCRQRKRREQERYAPYPTMGNKENGGVSSSGGVSQKGKASGGTMDFIPPSGEFTLPRPLLPSLESLNLKPLKPRVAAILNGPRRSTMEATERTATNSTTNIQQRQLMGRTEILNRRRQALDRIIEYTWRLPMKLAKPVERARLNPIVYIPPTLLLLAIVGILIYHYLDSLRDLWFNTLFRLQDYYQQRSEQLARAEQEQDEEDVNLLDLDDNIIYDGQEDQDIDAVPQGTTTSTRLRMHHEMVQQMRARAGFAPEPFPGDLENDRGDGDDEEDGEDEEDNDDDSGGVGSSTGTRGLPAAPGRVKKIGKKKAERLQRREQMRAYHEFMEMQRAERRQQEELFKAQEAIQQEERLRKRAVQIEKDRKRREQLKEREAKENESRMKRNQAERVKEEKARRELRAYLQRVRSFRLPDLAKRLGRTEAQLLKDLVAITEETDLRSTSPSPENMETIPRISLASTPSAISSSFNDRSSASASSRPHLLILRDPVSDQYVILDRTKLEAFAEVVKAKGRISKQDLSIESKTILQPPPPTIN
ncbi:hypothetical protein BGX28_001093 [Mortierella sp. GBA30]|nr:hypothetical protein BGX28_001093 [Mortierella sp. GBA30]